MPAVVPEVNRPARSVIKLSLGVSFFAVAMLVAAVFIVGAPTADASSNCTWSGGSNNWTAAGAWSCVPGQTYPGQNSGVTDTATFFSSPTVTLDSSSLSIPGSVALSVTGGAPLINVNSGGTLPLASASLTSGGTIAANSGGTVNVGGLATIGFSSKLWLDGGTINNGGTISISGGTFQASGGTLMGSGTTSIASGSTMTFDGAQGATTIQDAQINNSGTITVSSASNPVTLQFLAKLTNQSGGLITLSNDGPINFGGGSASIINNSGATIQKTGGTTSNVSVPLNNDGTVTVSTAGTTIGLLGGGTHTGTFSTAGGTGFDFNGTHNFNGAANFSGALTAHMLGGTWTINKPLAALVVSNFVMDSGTVNGTSALNVTNSATKNTNGTGSFATSLNLSGPLQVNLGLLDLGLGGGTSSSMTVSSGTLQFSSGSFLLNAGSSMAGAGLFHLTGAGTLDVSTPVNSPANFTQDGLNSMLLLNQPFSVVAGSTYSWNGGSVFFNSPTPTLDVTGGSILMDTSANPTTLNGGTLNLLSGSMRWGGGTNQFIFNANGPQNAVMSIGSGTIFDIQAPATIASGGFVGAASVRRIAPLARKIKALATTNSIIVNAGGTLQRSVNPGNAVIAVDVTNNGTVNATAGLIALSGQDPVTHTGNFNAGLGAIIDFSNGTHTIAAGSFTGLGTFELHGATLNLTPASISVANFDFASGTLQGSGNLTTTTQFIWDGGTMGGTGTTTLQGGTAAFSGANGPMILNRPLTVGGAVTATYNSPSVLDINLGSILNNGTFINTSASNVLSSGGGTFTNNNTYKYNSAAMTSFAAPFTNLDATNVLSGTENFTAGYTQNSGTTTLGPGNMGGSAITINGGILNGNGTITGNVTLGQTSGPAAALNPGTSPGSVTINGNYTQNATGTLNLDLNGPATPGTTYDLLTITGTATLSGTLNTITGYSPSSGDTFTPLTFGTRSGDFTTNNLTFPTGFYTKTYSSTAMQLAAVVLVDLAETISPVPSANAGSNVTYTVTTTNNPAPGGTAASYTVNVTMTNATISTVTAGAAYTCSVTSPTTATCTSNAALAPNTSTSFSVIATAPAQAGTMSISSTVTTANDSVPGNNTTSQTTTVNAVSDISVTKSGPPSAQPGQTVTFTITVTNNGPSDAQGVNLTDPPPARLTFVSATGACAAFPCPLGTITAGSSKTVQAKYTVNAGPTTTITNTATATETTPDSNASNNSGSATLSTGCPTAAPSNAQPGSGATNVPINGTLSWSDVGAASYTVYLDVQGANACTKFFGNTSATSMPYVGLQAGTTYQWRVEAASPGCPLKSSACMTFTTTSTCPTAAPVPISPVNTTASNTATFSWTAVQGATDYLLFINGQQIAKVTSTSFGPTPVPNGATTWYVIAEFAPPCTSLQSATATFNGCDSSATTIPSIVGQADSGQGYDLTWDAVSGASKYEVDEATDVTFTKPTTQSTTNTKLHFQHPVNTPTAFFYRVRAFLDCANAFGANSVTVRIVLSPVTNPTNPNVSAPFGNTTLVPITVHVPGFADGSFPFTASLDPRETWLVSVSPTTGSLPPSGLDFVVLANPTGMPAGTHTGTLIVSVNTTPSSGPIVSNGVTPVNAPVSVSLVTPVTPKPSGTPAANSLIIPSTGHLDGVNSRWASDVRILNTSTQSIHYQLTFTPDDTTQSQKQTIVQVDPNSTTALDDIVKTWYGVGSLGESSNGSLEIRPLDNPAKTGSDDVSVSFVTVATSRTYNAASSSTPASYGEFIPAIPFNSFVGKALDSAHAATVLGMQQIAQSDSMRTNLGVMEASGQPASILISVFNASGQKFLDVPMNLSGGQHVQLNGFLAQNKISLPDGRIEVQVTGGGGKIMAYASVIDNKSGDPILISGTPLRQSAFDTFVLPGVADLNTPLAAWRTDMRIFNPTTTPQTTTLTFYPLPGQGSSQSTSLTVNAGEVKSLDNTLSSTFGVTNAGGTIHVTTAAPQPLVVTGRTYNVTSNGTFGQLANAVTSADAIGQGDRPLQILQAEDSVRERTNLGLFEVTGKPATVEVTLFIPDSKISPSTQIPLPANGFIQVPIISSFGFSNVYNARVSMRVVGGTGKISAYGSVIDQITQDPTYIPAQH